MGTVEWSELLRWVPQEGSKECQNQNQREVCGAPCPDQQTDTPVQTERRTLTLSSL
jgi:hypothetical protein